MPKEQFISASVDHEAEIITFTFPTLGEVREFSLADVSTETLHRLALHGAEQKLRDSVAAPAGTDPDRRLARFDAVLAALRSGVWTVRRPGGEKEDPIDILARALAAVMTAAGKPRTAEDLRLKLESMSRSERARIRAIPEVAAEIARIKGKGASVTDLDL